MKIKGLGLIAILFLMASVGFSQKLYIADNGATQIQRSDLDGTNLEPVTLPGDVGSIEDIVIDEERNFAFWIQDDATNTIVKRATILPTGGSVRFSTPVDFIRVPLANSFEGLAIDRMARELFVSTSASGGNIYKFSLDASPTITVLPGATISSLFQSFGIDVDLTNGKMYFVNQATTRQIQMANLNGSSPSVILNISGTYGTIYDVATHPAEGKIYFSTVLTGVGQIYKADLDGNNPLLIVDNLPNTTKGIAVDPKNGFIYWATGTTTVGRAALDGSGATNIVTGLSTTNFITLDLSTSAPPKLYWTEGSLQEIHRINPDGSDFERYYFGTSPYPTGIAVDRNARYVYWADRNQSNIKRGLIGETDFESWEVVLNYTDMFPGIAGIDLDPGNTMIYFADAGNNRIQRADYSAAFPITGTDVEAVNNPFGLDLDLVNGKVYYTSNDFGAPNNGTLFRANLDGSGVPETLITQPSPGPDRYMHDVKVDPGAGLVYWVFTEADGPATIYKADIANVAGTVTPLVAATGGEVRGIEIDPSSNKIWWVCRGRSAPFVPPGIMEANLSDGSNVMQLHQISVLPPNANFIALDGGPPPPLPFITTWITTDNQIRIPTFGTGYNYNITWTNLTNTGVGDGSASGVTSFYDITGLENGSIYQVEITGTFPRIHMVSGTAAQRDKLRTVEQWGNNPWTSMASAFSSCPNLTIPAIDAPDLSNVTSMRSMFSNCTSFNQPIGHWDVSNVIDMQSLFAGASLFNQDLSSWDVSNVNDMNSMFQLATDFNQDIGGWQTGNVTNMSLMFSDAISFNQDIGGWDVSNVTAMFRMFRGAHVFNQNLNLWDVSKVIDMTGLFQEAYDFNGDISNWDVGMVEDFDVMFDLDSAFNQDIGGWNTSSVTSMRFTFEGATSFNQDISGWDVSMVDDMTAIFYGATSFNSPLNTWNVSQVRRWDSAFEEAISFNQPLDNWSIVSDASLDFMFYNATSFNQNLGDWDAGGIEDMDGMLDNTALTTANYDATLIGWATIDTGETPLATFATLSAVGLTYCTAETLRDLLITTYNWSITDGGKNCAVAPLNLLSTTPLPNNTNTSRNANIVLNFDQNVDGTTVNSSNITISGHQTGLIAGVFTGGGTPTITFNSTTDFKPGEIITVVISDRVRGSGGEIPQPVMLQFTVASGVGPGTFSAERVMSTNADGAKSVYAADIDGDGDMDIVSGSTNDDKVAWYENDGSQNFTERVISTSANSVRSVYAADVDGDGDMDVLSASIIDQKVAWYENDGSENFTERIIDTNPAGPVAILATDMDRDGDMDVVITANQDEVAWYENDGTQTFSKNIIDNTLDSPQALYASDVDSDGDTDVITVSWLDNTVAWHENDGFQSFTLRIISPSAQNPLSVFAIDIDEDGDVDVLSSAFDFSRIYRWSNNGSQVFSQNTVTTTLLNAIYVSAADMDGDGDIDVLGASQTDNEVVYYDNDGSEVFTENIVSSTALAVQAVIAADLDGDGDLDIISASGADDKIAWYENVVIGCASPPTSNAGIDQSICGASVVNLSGSVSNTSSSTWSTSGDGTFGNVALPNTTYTPGATDISNGTVMLTLTANDPDGAGPCIAAASNITITIDAAATVSVGPDLSICSSNTVNLSATTGGSASNPIWTSSGSGGFDDNTSLTATYTPDANDISNGMVNLTLTVDAAGVCPQVTDQLTVTISQPIVAASLSIQSNVSVISNVDVIAPSTINIGDVITTTIIQNPTKGTTAVLINNSVDYTANNGTVGADSFVYRICNQCGDCSDGTVTIDILNAPPVISNPTAPVTTVVGQSVLIPFSTLFSDINDNIDFTSIQVVAGPTSGAATSFDSNYDLTVDYTNVNFAGTDALTVEVCDLLGDCAQITLSIEVDGEITAHNGISPNGDGKNDYFNIANIQSIEPQNKVSIYNRWGDKVFEVANYNSTDPNRRFNGKSDDGKDLPSGVYFYKISFASGTPELSGYLTLKR